MEENIKFLDLLNYEQDREKILKALQRMNLGALPKIVLNEGLLLNKQVENREEIDNFLTERGADKNISAIPLYSRASKEFAKENPGFWRKKSFFCDADKYLMKRILAALGNPERKLKSSVIHITGSNGKGSVAAFIESIFRKNGYSVNKFTNPAVIKFNENITHNGEEIRDEEYYFYLKKILTIYNELVKEKEYLRTVESMFVQDKSSRKILNRKNFSKVVGWSFDIPIVALYFSERRADVNIIEVINGGLNDFTNIFTENEIMATVITYTQYGIGSNDGTMKLQGEDGKWFSSNRATAYHKAMLSKKNRPMIVANQTEDVLDEIRKVVKNNGGYTVEYGKDWFAEQNKNRDGFTFRGLGQELALNKSKILLEDNYQIKNISTALATIFSQNQFAIKNDFLQEAIDGTEIAGRLKYNKTGFYGEYFGDASVMSGYIKFNKSGIDSIRDIIMKLSGNIYIVYTTNNPKTEGENCKFFDIIKARSGAKLIIYKKSPETFNFLLEEANSSGVEYETSEYLSLALTRVKNMMKSREKNNVLILCNSMKRFDKNIVLLDRIKTL
ncbi:MAG: hypothetical protein LBB09_03895 [Rickettsiales bacterium]|jgi:folylpolyglutamate synthase/dihydrofolate synthase|nr:hypothetical protein [Rickettsiales bacterium]